LPNPDQSKAPTAAISKPATTRNLPTSFIVRQSRLQVGENRYGEYTPPSHSRIFGVRHPEFGMHFAIVDCGLGVYIPAREPLDPAGAVGSLHPCGPALNRMGCQGLQGRSPETASC
jgi:hypothetical protein